MKSLFVKHGIFFLGLILVGAGCLGRTTIPEEPSPTGDVDEVVDDTHEQISASGNIKVTSPFSGDAVTSPLVVTGEARVFENSVSWRIEDANGVALKEGFVTADSPDVGEFGSFEARIFLPVIETDTFTLQVFSYSARDGAEQDIVRVKLTTADAGKTSVNVFFVDPDLIANGGDCTQVDFEKRTVHQTVNVAELALEELLAGPESAWATTEVPEYTMLESISITGGVAQVDFSSPSLIDWNGGACRVSSLRSQIEQTLLQFPTVSSVQVTVNGSTDILEP